LEDNDSVDQGGRKPGVAPLAGVAGPGGRRVAGCAAAWRHSPEPGEDGGGDGVPGTGGGFARSSAFLQSLLNDIGMPWYNGWPEEWSSGAVAIWVLGFCEVIDGLVDAVERCPTLGCGCG